MRILIATNDQADGPGTESMGYLRAFRALGHEVEYFYYRKKSFFYSNFRKAWVRRMNQRLIERAKAWGADLLLVIRGGYIFAETIRAINRSTSCRTVNFYPDNPFGSPVTPPLDLEALRSYQLFLTRDRYHEEELRAQGVTSVRYLPHGFDAEFYRTVTLTPEEGDRFKADVSFVGAPYPFRVTLFDELVGPEVDFKIWGRADWKGVKSEWLRRRYFGGPLSPEDKVKVYNASTVNLNLQHPSGAVLGLDQRSFEVTGSGGLLLVNHKKGIDELFRPGEEVLVFSSREDLQRRLPGLLKHPEVAREIARRGQLRALAEHTHSHRVRTILQWLSAS